MNSRWQILGLVLVLCTGCGTVVGNPKKPKDEPKQDAIVFKVPQLELTVPSEAKDDDPALALFADDVPDNSDKAPLTAWAKRVDRVLGRINNFSERVNRIIDRKEDDVQGGVLVFKNRGDDNLVSGRVQTLAQGGEFGYEAVLCYDGKLLTHMRWTEAGDKVELTRDFGVRTAENDDSWTFLSTLKLVKTDKVSIDLDSQGTVQEGEGGEDGSSLTESSHIEKDDAGFRLRMVADSRKNAELPADGAYDGDRYLVGQVSPSGSEFVGFYKFMKQACSLGFDEARDDLWHPEAGSPRFCVGRPPGARKFSAVSDFYDTLSRLEAIGVQPKAALHAVKFQDGLTCE